MTKPSKENIFRVPITIPEEMFDYLTKLAIRAKVTGDRKLAITEIVRAIVSACLMESDVDFSGVKDEEELKERIKRAFS